MWQNVRFTTVVTSRNCHSRQPAARFICLVARGVHFN